MRPPLPQLPFSKRSVPFPSRSRSKPAQPKTQTHLASSTADIYSSRIQPLESASLI